MFKREPARILSLVSAVIALAVGFGLPVTSEQVGLIMAVVAVLVGEGTRSQVYSPASVEEIRALPLRGRVTER
jgi:hypothetical protein